VILVRRKLDPVQLWLGVRQVAIAGLPLATLYCFLFVVAKSVGWSAAWTPTVPMLVLQITGWVWLMYVVRSLFPNSMYRSRFGSVAYLGVPFPPVHRFASP